MNELELAAYRIERLQDAVAHVSNGNKADFGRKLGFQDGAFIRQMIAGTRPISEKTIWAIESLHGMKGWFAIAAAKNTKSTDGHSLTDDDRQLLDAYRSLGPVERGYLLEDAKKYQTKHEKK